MNVDGSVKYTFCRWQAEQHRGEIHLVIYGINNPIKLLANEWFL